MLVRTLESLPLATFLIYLALARPQRLEDWLCPYSLSSVLAILALGALRLTGQIANRIYLGIAAYFLSGALALVLHWRSVNAWYGAVEAAAMFCWVCVVGMLTTVASPQGFIGLDTGFRDRTRQASLLLLGAALLATALSFGFIGRMFLHAYLPFVALFAVQALLRARYSRSGGQL